MALRISKKSSISHDYYPFYSSENGDNEALCEKINVIEGDNTIYLDKFNGRGYNIEAIESIIGHLRSAVTLASLNVRSGEDRVEYQYPFPPLNSK